VDLTQGLQGLEHGFSITGVKCRTSGPYIYTCWPFRVLVSKPIRFLIPFNYVGSSAQTVGDVGAADAAGQRTRWSNDESARNYVNVGLFPNKFNPPPTSPRPAVS
jgi:hypothetical protein